MKTEVNDKAIWNEIYEKENFNPGWSSPGTDRNLLRIIKEELQGSEKEIKLLDIGCGNGRNSMITEEIGNIKYTGVDFADKALEYCRKTYSKDKTFIHIDITKDNLPLEKNYRIIIDCGCFHAIPPEKRSSYINNLKQHSDPNTLIIIGAWWRKESIEDKDKPTYFPYLYLDEWVFNKEDMENIFKKDFTVLSEYVDSSIYGKIKEGFAYFTLRRNKP